MKKEEIEEMKFLQEVINLRIEKIKLHQDSIEKLKKLNQIDRKQLDDFWDRKYKSKQHGN